jgi:hypothetical protein
MLTIVEIQKTMPGLIQETQAMPVLAYRATTGETIRFETRADAERFADRRANQSELWRIIDSEKERDS